MAKPPKIPNGVNPKRPAVPPTAPNNLRSGNALVTVSCTFLEIKPPLRLPSSSNSPNKIF